MISASGRYVLVYNGEIYNSQDLAQQLAAQGDTFLGHSDTEVLLAALVRWGVDETLGRLIGMFAFALWDREQQSLTLARDRLGIKPLYGGRQGDQVFFASELKSLCAHPDFKRAANPSALSELVAFNYICGPAAIYDGVHHVEPGTVLHNAIAMGARRRGATGTY